MARPKGTNIVEELINTSTNEKKAGEKKFQKLLVFDFEMKEILERESKKRGMTVAGFIKYCIMQEINK